MFNLVAGRDFEAGGTMGTTEVLPGDPTPDGSGSLILACDIEIGHIFALGRKYVKILGLTVLGENDKAQIITMGSRGIGVFHLVAAIVENTHDDKGLVWPVNMAPFQIHVLAAGKDPQVFAVAEKLARELGVAGVLALYDDRTKASAEVKFKGAELMGMPYLLVVGKGLANGTMEIHDRRAGDTLDYMVEVAIEKLLGFIRCELEKITLERTSTELIREPGQFELDQENGGAIQTSNS